MTKLSVFGAIIANPGNPYQNSGVDKIPDSLGYELQISGNRIYNYGLSTTEDTGILYVPENLNNCSDPAAPNAVPSGITSWNDIPHEYLRIAMVPLTGCVNQYLMQARQDQSILAAVLYNVTGSSYPLSEISVQSSWNFPIYSISSDEAAPLLQELVNYSGNLTSVPYGHNLSHLYPVDSYARLIMQIGDSGVSLPGLWIFLLIVLATLCLIVGIVSIGMHAHTYRARRDLRRRIAAGELDLEALGVKRLTVPKVMLGKMPIKTFGETTPVLDPNKAVETTMVFEAGLNGTTINHTSTPSDATLTNPTHTQGVSEAPNFDQTSCAICLDEFIPHESLIRELPCSHIFHPDCIDPYLSTRSSLCPLCKRSCLPRGYVPDTLQLTNATIARERRLRRMNTTNMNANAGTNGMVVEMGDLERRGTGRGIREDALAPTQEEEDEINRRRGGFRRALEVVFPVLEGRR
ncbi:Nucleolar protein 58 [Saitoella coloradoensis]